MSAAIGSGKRRRRVTPARIALYSFLILTALLWLVPIVGAIYSSFRPFGETVHFGFFSRPRSLTLDNYRNAWHQGDILRKYRNTAFILVPALVFTLFFSRLVAFV